ncbi:hypothetical protein MMC07_003549 [Pseudocyphellaria aurata]|nr:hypothetical protein [Pseudocyphellaria aurata]
MSSISIAIFTDLFLYSVIVPVIPFALTSRAGVAKKDVQHWVSVLLALYGGALVAGAPICGIFANKCKSRRFPLLLGLLALAASTLLLCLGRSLAAMCVGRFLQGLSAAVVWVVGLALVVDTVGPAEIGQMIGYVSISSTLAYFLGPIMGGIVFNRGGYYAVYYMSFGIILLDIILRTLLVEKNVAKQWTINGEPDLVDTPIPDDSHTHGSTVTDLETSTARPPNRHPVVALLSSSRFWSALWCSFVQSIIMSSWDATLPLHVAHLFDFFSLGAGLIFLPFVLPAFISPVVGKYVDAHGTRLPVVIGFLSCVLPLVLLRLVNHSGIRQIVLLCALLAVQGFTWAVTMVPVFVEVTNIVTTMEKNHPGVYGTRGAFAPAYGLYNCAFAAGSLVGPLWGGLVVAKAGWGTMCWSLALLSAVSALPAALWSGGWIFDKNTNGGGVAGMQEMTVGEGLKEAGKEDSKHEKSLPVESKARSVGNYGGP